MADWSLESNRGKYGLLIGAAGGAFLMHQILDPDTGKPQAGAPTEQAVPGATAAPAAEQGEPDCDDPTEIRVLSGQSLGVVLEGLVGRDLTGPEIYAITGQSGITNPDNVEPGTELEVCLPE